MRIKNGYAEKSRFRTSAYPNRVWSKFDATSLTRIDWFSDYVIRYNIELLVRTKPNNIISWTNYLCINCVSSLQVSHRQVIKSYFLEQQIFWSFIHLIRILVDLAWNPRAALPCWGKTSYEHPNAAKFPFIKHAFLTRFMNIFHWNIQML